MVLWYLYCDQVSLRNGVLFVLAWVACVACLCEWHASVGGVGDVLVWWHVSVGGLLAWVAWVAYLRGWRASVGVVVGVLAWVAC